MKTVLIYLVLSPVYLFGQRDTIKWMSFEPIIETDFIQITDKTLQQNKTSALGLTLTPCLTVFINKRLECGIKPSYTFVRSDFPQIESGKGYSLGYLLRYYPQKIAFKETIIGHSRKFIFLANPFIGFEHHLSTIYRDAESNHHFSNHLQTQIFVVVAGINVYFWRQFYFGLSLGAAYSPNYIENHFSRTGLWSFGYTFQKNKSKK
jgi:hypothetical protein